MTTAPRRSRIPSRAAVAALSVLAAIQIVPSAHADSAHPDCPAPVVLVHDIGRDETEFAGLAAALRQAGFCTATFTYGASAATEPLRRAGIHAAGLTVAEDSATELTAFLGSLADSGAKPAALVAHGSGSLVAQYVLRHSPDAPPIHTMITIGPMWHGTNIGELGVIERVSRDIGTYDTVLALETPIVDPICGGCRQIIAGSAFLTDLHRDGFPTPGVEYTDIVSATDGLVTPPLSQVPGVRSVTLQQFAPGSVTDHFGLPDDAIVQRLTVAALRQPTGPLT